MIKFREFFDSFHPYNKTKRINELKAEIKSLCDITAKGVVAEDALKAENRVLVYKLDKRQKRILELQDWVGDPVYVVRSITDDKLKFYDYNELGEQQLKIYHDQARSILKKGVFQNEVAYLKAQFYKWAAMESRDHDGVVAMRHQISGIELLEERLEEIPDPYKIKPTTEDLTSVI